MLYQIYETQRALMAPFADFAGASAKLYSHPLSPFTLLPLAGRLSAMEQVGIALFLAGFGLTGCRPFRAGRNDLFVPSFLFFKLPLFKNLNIF